MSRRNRERSGQPRKKRNWFLLPLLLVGGLYAAWGASELLPVSRHYGIFWTAAAAVCLLFLGYHTFRAGGSPRRAENMDEEPAAPPSPEPDPASGETERENLALDEEISHEVYLRAKAAADAEAEREARERLRQLRALRALESITEEEYEAERRKVWESM